MPIIPFTDLHPNGTLKDAADRLASLAPGLVLTAGQSVSGKVTLLLALTSRMAAQAHPVVLLTDQLDHFEPFRPLPANWTEVHVQPNATAWQRAVHAATADDALIVVSPLNRANAPAVVSAARSRWVFAALDTLLAGLDASYPLREMGVGYDAFAESVRCVWSQSLVPALCGHCAANAEISRAEIELLFPASAPPLSIKQETGCAKCGGCGTAGQVSIADVTLVTDDARPVIKGALVQGVNVALDADHHIAALDQARELVEQEVIGLDTYRSVIQRNPLLRTRNALALVKVQAEKLNDVFDTLVASLWLDIGVLTAVADRTAAGVVVAEEDRRIHFANARARQALVAQSDLSIEDDRIVGRTARVRRSLSEALGKAVGREPAATRLTLEFEGAAKRDVFVTPLPTVRGFAQPMRRLALIVVGGTGEPESLPSGQDLRQYFDLTPAESKVALLLCAGHAPKAVARELQVTLPTVRSHVRALLEKTGTSRQTQLIQLLSSLPRGGPDEARVDAGVPYRGHPSFDET